MAGQGLRDKGKKGMAPCHPSCLSPRPRRQQKLLPAAQQSIWNQSSSRACSLYLENGFLLTRTVSQTEDCHHPLPAGKPSEIFSDR